MNQSRFNTRRYNFDKEKNKQGLFVILKTLFRLTPLFLGAVLLVQPVYGQPVRPGAEPAFAPGGALSCLGCHSDATSRAVLDTPHAISADDRTPFADADCESCHGASPEHRRLPRIPVAMQFSGGQDAYAAAPVSDQNQVCLGCHENGGRTHWPGSSHEFADLACVSCHNIHSRQDNVLSAITQSQVCFECHAEKRSQLQRRSHHPVLEGLMACTSCHNPHGSTAESLLTANNVLETCTECHAEKRGPFLWEHQPVSDNCTNCHNPHGSTQNRLLSVRQPFLCQGCHQDAFHPSTLYSGDDVPPLGAAQQVLGQACTNCHVQIHGSNHPSGSRFTR